MHGAIFLYKLLADFSNFAAFAAPAVIASLWQGLALALGLSLVLRCAPRISAAHRFALWCAGFIAVVALPFLPLLSGFASSPSSADTFNNSAAVSAPGLLHVDNRWALALAALWLLASGFRAANLLFHSMRLRKLWRTAQPAELTTDFSSVIISGRRFEICTTSELDRPSVIGFFAPRILIPHWLFARLTPGELQQIVLHEAEHLRRRDDWTNLLQKLCLVAFPLNPALYWIDRRLGGAREMACDEGVIRITHAPRAYAACLAGLAERGLHRRAEALSLGAWQRRPELVHRIHSILRSKNALHPFASRTLLGVLSCSLLFASFELAHSPQLIAFAPSISDAQPLAASRLTAAPAELIGAVDIVARLNANDATNITALPAKAALPAHSTPNHPCRMRPATPRTQNDSLHKTRPSPSAQGAQLASLRQAAKPAVTPEPRHVLILTTFEQIETTINPNAQLTADYDTTAPGTSDSANDRQPNQAASRITVTRLILKVGPSHSKNPQAAAIPLGNGWFVIQL